MMSNERIIEYLLTAEGWPKYTDAPADRGGPTKGGIAIATLAAWRKRPVDVADLKALTEDEARRIYLQRYITGPRFDSIDDELLRWQVVDAGVLSGPARVTRWLQQAAGASIDGILGPRTTAAVNAAPPHKVALKFAASRVKFLGALIEGDRSQAKWAEGWMNRAMKFVELEAERA